METKETIVFNRIIIPDLSITKIASIFDSWKYTEETGIGFTYVHIEDEDVVAKVLVKTPSYVQNYNLQENVFEKSIVYIYDEMELVLDLRNGLVFSTTSSTKFNKAKSLLRNCFKSKITFNNIECSAEKMLEKIHLLGWISHIKELSIKNFVYRNGAIGRLSVHINNSEIGKELLSLYPGNIARITLIVESKEFSDFILSVASQNSITIKSEESEFWQIISLIKQNL